MTLPVDWVRALGLHAGDRLEIHYDDVLLAVPRQSPQAERVRRAFAEEE
jgi:hypothetical protein